MRKVLSFVLVLALVMSSFSMAFAADTTSAGLSDIAGTANEDAIQVNYDLGIVTGNPDGTFLPDKDVNRAEFAAMITRALAIPDSALAGYTTTSFKDTTGYTWAVPYLAFCQSKGILLGDGNGNVMPGRTISVNEAMTMALRAIGYTANSALLVGAWPANYVSLAQNNDLYDDVSASTTVDKASAAQIIYNLLTVQKVSVNTDGTTNSQWVDGDEEGDPLNLLNSNLNCTAYEDEILGRNWGYDDAIINITDDIGAYGTVYVNDDDEIVAFTKDSTALTGSVNDDGDFEVGDVTYEFGDNEYTSNASLFVNTDSTDYDHEVTYGAIQDWAILHSDDDDTLTINADVSGKKIKDIYSVVAWDVTYDSSSDGSADSDVQDDITDKELLSASFVENDDDAIDLTSFALVGITSLDKIAEDNVLYVYTDGDGDIRKVMVGTETIVGAVEEVDVDDETVTIAGTEYDMAPSAIAEVNVLGASPDIDSDSEGTFWLDANGAIYDFDGTTSTDTYAVIKAAEGGTGFDNIKLKLYKSDDSTTTYYFAEDDARDIEWTTNSNIHLTAVTSTALTTGALIGYSLDSDGNIDAMNVSTEALTAPTFQSTKVLKNGGISYKINSDAVVFTYGSGGMTDTGNYDVCDLADVDTGTLSETTIILDDDGNISALFISEANADVNQDDIYGVFNKKYSTTDDDDDAVYRFAGFVDGTAFSYKTDDETNVTGLSYANLVDNDHQFGVYAITLDSSDLITEVNALAYSTTLATDEASGMITQHASTLNDLDEDNTIMTFTDGNKYTVADDAVVYEYDEDDEVFTVSKLSSIDDNDTVSLYDTKGDDADGIASVVIFIDN
jgi:hypothetical protein